MKTIPSQQLPNEVVASLNQSIAQARKDERRKVWEEAAKIAELQKAEEGLKHVQYGEEGRMTASNASLRQAMMAARLASIFRAKAEE